MQGKQSKDLIGELERSDDGFHRGNRLLCGF